MVGDISRIDPAAARAATTMQDRNIRAGTTRNARSGGLSLMELLVAIATIGLMLAVPSPTIQHVREQARLPQCANRDACERIWCGQRGAAITCRGRATSITGVSNSAEVARRQKVGLAPRDAAKTRGIWDVARLPVPIFSPPLRARGFSPLVIALSRPFCVRGCGWKISKNFPIAS